MASKTVSVMRVHRHVYGPTTQGRPLELFFEDAPLLYCISVSNLKFMNLPSDQTYHNALGCLGYSLFMHFFNKGHLH